MAPLPENPERRLGGLDFILSRCAELYPQRICIDDRLCGRALTYRELQERSLRLAWALRGLGVAKGERIGYAFHNEHASIEALFACALLGAVAVPLNTRLSPRESGPYLTAQGCRVFIARDGLQQLGEDAGTEHLILRGESGGSGGGGGLDYESLLAAHEPRPIQAQARWEDPYMLAMTGGTTGGSKAVAWTHGGSLLDILSVIANLGVRRGHATICYAPTYHAAGLGWAFMPSFWQGGTVIFPASTTFDPAFFYETVRARNVEYMFLVPAMIGPLYQTWDGVPVRGLRSLGVASAPTPERQRKMLSEIFPETDLVIGYGMTETFSISVQSPSDFLAFPAGAGEAALDARIRVVDEDGRVVPPGTEGQIVARTLATGLYYNNDPENTQAAFRTLTDDEEGLEWVFTGDIGVLDADGRLTIVDRLKDVIISGGENISSVEVETLLMADPAVKDCAVVGRPDERWGERVCAVIVPADPEADSKAVARALLARCHETLARYKAPKEFAFVEALPRSPFGKVLKRDLRETGFEAVIDAAKLK